VIIVYTVRGLWRKYIATSSQVLVYLKTDNMSGNAMRKNGLTNADLHTPSFHFCSENLISSTEEISKEKHCVAA
jgi:hypothetical protein